MQRLVAILDLPFLGAYIKIMVIGVIMLYINGYNTVLS